MFAAFFMVFSVFLMFAVFRLLPPQGGESVAPYQAFGAHPLMQIAETLHIKHCSKSLHINITPFFPTLQADPSDSANDTKTASASCYRNRGGSLALFVLFQALTQNLAGILDRSLGGCQNYRAFTTVICRFFNTLYLQRTASLY
jgi:ethanolamine transporter EutH